MYFIIIFDLIFVSASQLTAEFDETLKISCKCLRLSASSGVKCTLTFGVEFSHGLSIKRNEFVLVPRFVFQISLIAVNLGNLSTTSFANYLFCLP